MFSSNTTPEKYQKATITSQFGWIIVIIIFLRKTLGEKSYTYPTSFPGSLFSQGPKETEKKEPANEVDTYHDVTVFEKLYFQNVFRPQ